MQRIQRMVGRGVVFFLCFLLIVGVVGCGSERLRKKFIRQPKEKKKPAPIIYTEEYDKKYSVAASYKDYYFFWKSWHEELINALDGNRKKQIQCLREALNNLKKMEDLLTGEKKESLKSQREILEKINNQIVTRTPNELEMQQIKENLRRQKRAIEKEFTYEKAKEWLRE